MLARCILAAALLGAASGAHAQYARAQSVDSQVMNSDTFLSAHPDLRFRLLGLKAWQGGDYAKAMVLFRRAARFADKPAQGMVAEMLWNGQGGPMNRPLAHAWIDVAAERQFRIMEVTRDRYWREMTEAERAQALALAPALVAEYGDKVAKPRLERKLREVRTSSVGSRTGFVGNVQVTIPSPSGDVTVDGSQFYQDKFWKPEAYWKWQAEDWKELSKGQVKVNPLQAKPAR
jgi:hypothetical protein